MNLNETHLSNRAILALRRQNIRTVEELLKTPTSKIQKFAGVGYLTLQEISRFKEENNSKTSVGPLCTQTDEDLIDELKSRGYRVLQSKTEWIDV